MRHLEQHEEDRQRRSQRSLAARLQAGSRALVLVAFAVFGASLMATTSNGQSTPPTIFEGHLGPVSVNGGAKTGHLAAQNPASGGAPSDMGGALLR